MNPLLTLRDRIVAEPDELLRRSKRVARVTPLRVLRVPRCTFGELGHLIRSPLMRTLTELELTGLCDWPFGPLARLKELVIDMPLPEEHVELLNARRPPSTGRARA